MNSKDIYESLRGIVGVPNVSDSDAVTTTYGFDASPTPPSKAGYVVLPENTVQVKHVLELANRYRVPVTTLSGGVNVGGTSLPTQGGIVLDLKRMNRILEVNTDASYVVIEPGVTYDELTARLAEENFRCQIPTSPGGSTPVGNQLVRPSGSLSNRHIDAIIGLEVILPNGNVVNTGSGAFPFSGFYMRYGPFPDLAGLFCCSHGTLGVVTKASLKIYPINEDIRLPISAFDSFSSSVEFVKEICRRNIAEHAIIWNRHFYKSYEIKFSDDNRLQVPQVIYDDPREDNPDLPYNLVTIHMSGFKEDMDAHERLLPGISERMGGRLLSGEECKEIIPSAVQSWDKFYRDYRIPTMEQAKKYGLGRYVPWIVVGEPRDIIKIEKEAVQCLDDLGVRPICYYSMPFDYGRSIFFRIFSYINPAEKETLGKVRVLYQNMYDQALRKYGAVPFRHRRDPLALTKTGGYQLLLRAIKQTVDPNNIMNPGVGIF